MLLFALPAALASAPVDARLTGCVAGGVFYSVSHGEAYPISLPTTVDVTAYEGKTVVMNGSLSPGDRFDPEGPVKAGGACAPEDLVPIRWSQAVTLRVAAAKAAKAGDLAGAVARIEEAVALYDTPDCDVLSDRVQIRVQMGDLAAAGEDFGRIRTKACAWRRPSNQLLMEDVGDAYAARGELARAKEAWGMALAVCDADYCRKDLDQKLAAPAKAGAPPAQGEGAAPAAAPAPPR